MTAAGVLLVVVLGAAEDPDAGRGLVRSVGGAEIDWAAGTVVARAGVAADMRMPSPELARPGAERKARAAAVDKLRAALKEVPLRGARRLTAKAVDEALARAYTVRVDYQSNGGVLLALGVRFEHLGAPAPAGKRPRDGGTDGGHDHRDDPQVPRVTLAVPSMPLEVAPEIALGEREVALGWVVYRTGAAPAEAITVRRDRAGRLVLPKGEGDELRKLAGAPAIIYVQKPK